MFGNVKSVCLGAALLLGTGFANAQSAGVLSPWDKTGTTGLLTPGQQTGTAGLPTKKDPNANSFPSCARNWQSNNSIMGAGYAVDGVTPILRGFCPAPDKTTGYIVDSLNQWDYQYPSLLTQWTRNEQPFQTKGVVDFNIEDVVVIKIGADLGENVTPVVESITHPFNAGTQINYALWVPMPETRSNSQSIRQQPGSGTTQGAAGKLGSKGTGSTSFVVTQKRPATTPFVVVKFHRVAGNIQFAGRIQYFRPCDGDR